MSLRLLDLPNELLAVIVCYIEDVDSLRALARTCRRLQRVAEAELYRYVLQRTGKQAIQLGEAVKRRPSRADALQVIDSRCKWNHRLGLLALAEVIARATYLKELTVESPYCTRAYPHGSQMDAWKGTMHGLLWPVCSITHRALTRLTKRMSFSTSVAIILG